MKKLLYIALVIVFGLSFTNASAATVNGRCQFDSGQSKYFCSADAEDQVPAGCTAQLTQTPATGMYCTAVPAGYSAPSISVSISADPATGSAGNINPTITWSATGVASDPTTCTGTNFSTGGKAQGNVAAGIIQSPGAVIYSITCKNGSSSKTAVTTVTVNSNAGSCQFSGDAKNYTCKITSGIKPSICSSVGGDIIACPTVPNGYTPPSRTVSVTVTPKSGEAGKINPTVTWSVEDTASDPATCNISGLVSNGPAQGSASPGVISTPGSVTYTASCSSKIPGVITGSQTVTVAAASQPAQTQTISGASAQKITYSPLEPLPGLEKVQDLNFASFLGVAFKLLITAGALLAVATLVYAGISYILSEAFETKGEAKHRMQAALFGLVILLGAWIMLNTINPALLRFDLSSIGTIGGGAGNTGGTTQTQTTSSSANPSSTDFASCESDGRHILEKQQDGTSKCVFTNQ